MCFEWENVNDRRNHVFCFNFDLFVWFHCLVLSGDLDYRLPIKQLQMSWISTIAEIYKIISNADLMDDLFLSLSLS